MAFTNSLPGVYEVISDGNLNLVAGSSENTILKIGVCTGNGLGTLGVPNTVAAYGSQSVMVSALGAGALVDNLACQLNISGGPVLAMPVNPSQPGSVQATTHAGSGVGRADGYAAVHQAVIIFIKTGGALGAGTFEYNVNLDGYSTPQTLPSGGTFRVPGTFLVVSFGAGTYVANDVYLFNVDGTVVHSGTGLPTVGVSAASPLDNYYVSIQMLSGGANGTAQFQYALDNSSFSAPQITPSGGLYVIPNAGLYVEFTGPHTQGDNYSFLTCGPSFSNTDLTNALNAIPINLPFSMVEVVRGAMLASAASAAIEAATVETALEGLFNTGTSARGVISVPSVNGASVVGAGLSTGSVSTVSGNLVVDSSDTDAAIKAAFANTSAIRVSAAPGDFLQSSPLTGLVLRRPASWTEAERLAGISAATDGGEVDLGGLPTVVALFRDEALTPGLDIASGQHFTTLRTINGDPGFFLTNVLTLASAGSDYQYMTNARVIDRAAQIARSWAIPLINKKVPTTRNPNAVPGSVSAGYASQLNLSLTGTLSNEMVPSDCVAVKGQVDTTHNVLADRILPITVSVQVYAYSAFIDITLGVAVQVA